MEKANYDLYVEVENGKYAVIQEKDGNLYALRYGEKWRDLCGDKLVLALAYEVAQLREKVNQNEVICPDCKNKIDPDYCWCGSAMDSHDIGSGHSPVPAGCTCGYLKEGESDDQS